MKKRVKGIIMFLFLGGIMVTSGVVIGIPGVLPEPEATRTGTPMDRFADADRPRLCGSDGAGSTAYVTEYEIARACTQPLAITVDPDGLVWFTQSNTGNLGRLDPSSGEFSEFFNPAWPADVHSMMWGIAYYPDGSIWYTDDALDSIWKYGIDDGRYLKIDYTLTESTFPHSLSILGDQIIVNDYTGGRLSYLLFRPDSGDLTYWNLPSPEPGHITSPVAIDSSFNNWYANWDPEGGEGGSLLRFDIAGYYDKINELAEAGAEVGPGSANATEYVTAYELPESDNFVNGLVADVFNRIWFTDTNSSDFYLFDDGEYTRYTTPPPLPAAYGNATGIVQQPLSRPYLAETDSFGRMVFNEQTANRIGVFDPIDESLTEYIVPSQNPHWADCDEEDAECGYAQVLGITVDGTDVWFTEWAENNIGHIDTSLPVSLEVTADTRRVELEPSGSADLMMNVTRTGEVAGAVSTIAGVKLGGGLGVEFGADTLEIGDNSTETVTARITAGGDIRNGTHKIAIGAGDEDVIRSVYVTVEISGGEDAASDVEEDVPADMPDGGADQGGEDGPDGMPDGVEDGADEGGNDAASGGGEDGQADMPDGGEEGMPGADEGGSDAADSP